MLYQLQKGDDVLKSSKKTPEERIKELQENGEVFPASNDYIYKAIMTNCFLFKVDMTYQITDIPKDLILKTPLSITLNFSELIQSIIKQL